MAIYKLDVLSPWRLHLHWGPYWRWLPVRWATGFQVEYWWLCFRFERHVVAYTDEGGIKHFIANIQ
jgi:hypothetical protein